MLDAMLAGCLSMLVTLAAGQPILSELRRRKLAKAYSGEEPEAYAAKAGTPTMGGLMFLLGVTVAALVFAVPKDGDVLIPLLPMLAAGALAAFYDFQTLVGGPPPGRPR